MTWDSMLELGRRLITLAAAGGILVTGLLFILDNNKVQSKIASMAGTPEIMINLSGLNQRVTELSRNVEGMTERLNEVSSFSELTNEPVIKFSSEGNFITDAQIGGLVTFTIRMVKLRECGRAEINAWFKNGAKVAHAFQDLSIVDYNGKSSIRLPVDPGEVVERSFTARIPNSEGVTPGTAVGWVEVAYPDCPRVPVEITDGIIFEILDDDGRPFKRYER